MSSYTENHHQYEYGKIEEKDSVEEHWDDCENIHYLKGSSAVFYVSIFYSCIEQFFRLFIFLSLLTVCIFLFNKLPWRTFEDSIVNFKNTEIDGKDEDPEEDNFEGLAICIILAIDC